MKLKGLYCNEKVRFHTLTLLRYELACGNALKCSGIPPEPWYPLESPWNTSIKQTRSTENIVNNFISNSFKISFERTVAVAITLILNVCEIDTSLHNKQHAMHAEAMTFHKGSLIIFRTFVKKLGYIKVTDNFCAEWLFNKNCVILAWHTISDIRCKVKRCLKLFTPFVLKNGEISVY